MLLRTRKVLLATFILAMPINSALVHAEGIQNTINHATSELQIQNNDDTSTTASSSEIRVEKRIILRMNERDVIINNEDEEPVSQTLSQAPIFSSDIHQLVPLREILEILGCEVNWIPEGQKVLVISGERMILMTLNSKIALVNGKKVTLQTNIQSIKGTSFVPLEDLPVFGFDVAVNVENQTFAIMKLSKQ